ncbi:hypothetical protein ACLOAV_001947 [Pseudogymnoascus australis]
MFTTHRAAEDHAKTRGKFAKSVLAEVKNVAEAVDKVDGGVTEKIQELLDKLDGKDGTIPKGFAELRKVFKGADGAGDIKALLGTLQALPEQHDNTVTKLLDEQNTAIEKLTTEQEKVTAALSKIADTAGNVARHKSDNEKLADELARAKAHIDQLKADISTADIRRDELVANNGEAIGEMRATARRHEEENIGLKAQIAELRHQHAGQVEPREQPLPLVPWQPDASSRGNPPHSTTTARYADGDPIRDSFWRRRGSALEEENRKKSRAVLISDLSSKTVEWAISTSDDEDEDMHPPPRVSSASSGPMPFISGGRPANAIGAPSFEPEPSAPTTIMSALPASGSFEPASSAGAAMRRYSPGSPSQRTSSGLARHRSTSSVAVSPGSPIERTAPGSAGYSSRGPGHVFSGFPVARDPMPDSRPQSVMSGASGGRGPFARATTISLFSSGPAGRGVFSGPTPASVLPDPSQGRDDFSGAMAATAAPVRANPNPVAGGSTTAPVPVPVSNLTRTPSPAPSGTVAVRSPLTMAIPVEFLCPGRLRDGAIAHSVSVVAIDHVTAKISEWWARVEANRPEGGRLWAQTTSRRKLCIELKSRTSRAVVAQPASDYYDPEDGNPAFACPRCVPDGLPCVWSTTKTDPARVLPLPVAARAPGATPQTEGYCVCKSA